MISPRYVGKDGLCSLFKKKLFGGILAPLAKLCAFLFLGQEGKSTIQTFIAPMMVRMLTPAIKMMIAVALRMPRGYDDLFLIYQQTNFLLFKEVCFRMSLPSNCFARFWCFHNGLMSRCFNMRAPPKWVNKPGGPAAALSALAASGAGTEKKPKETAKKTAKKDGAAKGETTTTQSATAAPTPASPPKPASGGMAGMAEKAGGVVSSFLELGGWHTHT